jgi:hypothetical protein
MKVSELIELLSKKNPDDNVKVRVELPHATIGPTKAVDIAGAVNGFDWDNGKVFLTLPLGTHLFVGDQKLYRENIQYKQLVGSIRGKEDLENVRENFLSVDEFKDIIISTCGELPNCIETVHQTDRFHIYGSSALAKIFEKFQCFEVEEEDE